MSLFFDLPGTGVHSGRRITGGVIPSFSFSMNSGGFSNFDFNFLANKLTFESTTISSALTADVRIQGFSSQLKIGAAQTNDFTFGNDESSKISFDFNEKILVPTDRPHRKFPTIENQHGTFMFHHKDLFLLAEKNIENINNSSIKKFEILLKLYDRAEIIHELGN